MSKPATNDIKDVTLGVRLNARMHDEFNKKCVARAVKPTEAARSLIAAWLRNPQSVEFGLPDGDASIAA